MSDGLGAHCQVIVGQDDIEAGVPLLTDERLTGVEAHPDAEDDVVGPRGFVVRSLGLDRRGHCLAGTCERIEERIALRVDLLAVMLGKGGAQQAPMLAQELGVAVSKPLQKLRAAFDIGEHEGDRPAGNGWHAARIPITAPDDPRQALAAVPRCATRARTRSTSRLPIVSRR